MTDPTRDLLIRLASHMAYMQGQLEADNRLDELDDLEDFYWFRESVALRQKVADALAGDPTVPTPPADGEVAELTGQLIEAANGAAAMGWDKHAQSILRAAELLQRQRLAPEEVTP